MDYITRDREQRWWLDNKEEFYAWVYGRACAKAIGLELSDDIDEDLEEIFRLSDRGIRGNGIAKAYRRLKAVTILAEIAMENIYAINESGYRHASGDPTTSE